MLNPQILSFLQQYLAEFAATEDFESTIESIFGTDIDRVQLVKIRQQWLAGAMSVIPPIEIRRRAEINGANGAFSLATGKIYLAQELLENRALEEVVPVLLEEYGHFVDAQLNTVDASGDEGAIFSALVRGKVLDGYQLSALRSEDDTATVLLDGKLVQIEQDIDGDAGNNNLVGTDGDDTINAGVGIDTVNGGAGNDLLIVDYSSNTYTGTNPGAGLRTSSILPNSDPLSFDGVYSANRAGSFDLLTFSNIERFQITGTIADDMIATGAGNDTINGGVGNDTIDGGAGNDILNGGAGNDTIDNNRGIDTIDGGEGIDTLVNSDFSSSTESLAFVDTGVTHTPINLIDGSSVSNTEHFINLITGSGNDTINFTQTQTISNIISTGSGDDTINAGVGSDTVNGGAGNDLLIVDYSSNTYTGTNPGAGLRTPFTLISPNSDPLSFEGRYQANRAGSFDQLLFSNIERFQITGTIADDMIATGAGNDTINGGVGNDTIDGGAGNDILNGGADNDTIDNNRGIDTIDGGEGIDTLVNSNFSSSTESLAFVDTGVTNALINLIDGSSVSNIEHFINLITGSGNDTINFTQTQSISNTISTGSGDDTINAGVGIDTVNGGAGNDLLIVDYSSNTYTGTNPGAGLRTSSIFPNSDPLSFDGAHSANRAGSFDQLTFSNIERFQITGTIADDRITTGAGNDTINGGVGNDTIDGGAGNDILNGGAGNDTIDNNRGIDTIDGGEGIDTLVNSDFSISTESLSFVDTGVTNAPINLIDSSSVSNIEHFINLITGSGNDTINFTQTQSINNNISTGSGDDTINAGVGIDTVNGGAGNDLLIVDYSSNTYTGTNPAAGFRTPSISPNSDPLSFDGIYNATRAGSFDQLFFSNIERFQITGTIVDDRITTGAGNDIINGGAGNDTIDGGAGNDILNGGAGNDTIDNNRGIDTIDGGEGIDTLVNSDFSSSTESLAFVDTGVTHTPINLIDSSSVSNIEHFINLITGSGNDTINFTQTQTINNNISTGSGDDTINAGVGIDTVNGGAGNDLLIVDYSSNTYTGTNPAAGFRTPSISPNSDPLSFDGIYNATRAGSFDQLFFSNIERFQITGTIVDDRITTGAGNDIINGGAGNDTINGGGGDDTINGGSGDDIYILNAINASGSSIQDSAGTDSLSLLNAQIVLSEAQSGRMGLGRLNTSLIVDLNQDGVINPGTDLSILDFYNDSFSNTAGIGFLENIGNISGGGVLGLTLLDLNINVNEAPTAVTLTNSVTSLAENTNTAARLKVADIGITDDALGTNNLSLSGADAGIFEIFDNDLYVRAGTVFNFATKSSYAVAVAVDDLTVGNTPDATTNFTLGITDVNEAPTAVTLTNSVTSLAENTNTTTRLKVADISITDDALGTNSLSLSGADADIFEIFDNDLYVKAGTVLDFETKSSYAVTVAVDDLTVGNTPDATTNFTLGITDVNEAPTAVTLTNSVTSLAENTNTAARLKVADISITDDVLGTNNLSLSGADADIFEIFDNDLYVRAGTVLDFETKSSYAVTVAVDDLAVGNTPDATTNFTLGITDVFEDFSLSTLNGTNGFAINGINADDNSGYSVSSVGDINGDGIDDLIIGARYADPNGNFSGQSYVVFGSRSGFSASLNLSTLIGTNGFAINGINAYDNSGRSVSSAGDINGDGIDDLIIGALFADPNGNIFSGQSYVVFGSRSPFSSSINLSTITGTNGFRLNGVAAGDRSGISVSSAGDINGDGIDDLIIGAYRADLNRISDVGQSYVVFGRRSTNSINLSTLTGADGFRINGIAVNDRSGTSVSSAGDINGDGIDDLIIGAPNADPNGSYSGQSYVVFGSRTPFSANLNLSTINGANGFAINGINLGDRSGTSVSSAGDINGDGIDDLIIGARDADSNGNFSGQSYVVFGSRSPFSANLNLSTLTGANGFAINGINADDDSGISVSSAGDINGDGIDDLIIGAPNADPNGISNSGQSYVVFGSRSPFSANLNLSTLIGTKGFTINGINADDRLGISVSSAGDINNDGIDDLIIGADRADPNGSASGQSYVVYGNAAPELDLDLNGSTGFTINGIDFNTTFIGAPIAVVDTDLTLVDRNSPNLTGATITITNPLNGAAETLNVTTTGSITSSYSNGVLTLSGSGTVAQYQQVLRTVTYNNTTATPISTPRTITFVVNDGAASSNASMIATTTLSFNNAAPINTVPTAQTVNEDTQLAITGISVIDVDGNLATTQLNVTNGALNVTLNGATISSGANNSNTLTLSGTQTQINNTLATLKYQGNLNFNGSDTLTVLSIDSTGTPLSDSDTVEIIVNSVNNAPVNSFPTAQTVNEDTQLAITGISVIDVDGNLATTQLNVTNGTLNVTLNGATISSGANNSNTITLSGTQTQINNTLATLKYQGNLNFNGSDTLTVLSIDSTGTPLSDSDTVEIIVNSVNNAPVNSFPTAQTVNEDTQLAITGISVIDVDGNLATTQLNVTNGTLNVTLNGATISSGANNSNTITLSGTQTQINNTLATLKYQGNPNFNGSDTLTVLSTDSTGTPLSDSDTVGITVNFVNTAPELDLNGTNNLVPGFAINGVAAGDLSGTSVSSAGDINGDGIDDLIIGADLADSNGTDSGQSYVVFGSRSGFSSSLNLSTLTGTNGFRINGVAAGDNSGTSVSSAGDINGDGLDDLIIGALFADPNGISSSGQSYIVFGSRSGFSSSLNLSTLDGDNGFQINGINLGDRSGASVSSAGDINGDGIDDLIIGALFADPNGISRSGQSYVVFGSRSGFSSSLNLSTLIGTNGFAINGISAGVLSGRSVSSAGDINGDGIDDLIIGATGANPNGNISSGQSYVVFGSRSGFSSSLNLSTLTGTNGFGINGVAAGDNSGRSVSSAGDINGDGLDDLIIGADLADPNGISSSGQSYVVFGSRSPFSSNLNLSTLTGADGFHINGIALNDRSGTSVSSAGDINGDGLDDLIIGAAFANPNGISSSGQSYVVFGSRSPFSSNLNLSTLNGTNGFAVNGINAADISGLSVSGAGDINGDGIDDLIIGAAFADPNGNFSGQSYVVFGRAGIGASGTLELSQLSDGIDFNTTFIGTPIAVVDTDLTLVDRNSPNLTGATITITNPLNGAAETLSATTTGSITSSYGNGVLTLSGSGTVAQYQQVLRTVTYNNTATALISTPRIITFLVNDGAASSNTSTIATTTLLIGATIDRQISAANDITLDLIATTDSGTSDTDNITRFQTPIFAVTFDTTKAQFGDILEIRNGATVLGTTTLTATQVSAGTANVTLTTALTGGLNTLSAVHRDLAGNSSTGINTLGVTFDQQISAANAVTLDLRAASDSGVSQRDNITNVATPTIALTFDNTKAQAGDILEVRRGSIFLAVTVINTAQVNAGRANVTLTTSLANGLNTLSAVHRDRAGNSSFGTNTLGITFDQRISATNVVTLDLLATSDSGVSQIDNITNVARPTFALTFDNTRAQAGDILEVRRGNVVLGTRTLTAAQVSAGTVNLTLATALTNVSNNLSAVHRDLAGNTVTSATLAVTRDNTEPLVPVILGYSSTSVTGTAPANTTLLFSTSSSLPRSFAATTAISSNNYTINTSSLVGSSAGQAYYLYAQDVAGNLSVASPQRVVVGAATGGTLSNVGGTGSDLLVGNNETLHTVEYAVSGNNISLTGQINASNVTSQSVNIKNANIDVFTSIEQLNFIGSGYGAITANTPGLNQLRGQVQNNPAVLLNNSISAFTGAYDASLGTFSIGSANSNATLVAFDSNSGFNQNYEAFLLLDKTSISGSIGFNRGVVSLTL